MENKVERISVDMIDDPAIAMRSDIDEAYIEELGQSIKNHGLINPISIKRVGDRYEVIAGHQRLLAARRVGIVLLECIVRDLDSDESLIITAHENMVRLDVNPVDEAVFLGRLVTEKSLAPEQIAKMLRRSLDWVEQRLTMLNYPANVLDAIGKKELSMGAALYLMRITDEPYRDNLIEIARKDGITAGTADRWWQNWKLNLLPLAPTAENMVAFSAPEPPPASAVQCARCKQSGLIRDCLTVWVHRDFCPE